MDRDENETNREAVVEGEGRGRNTISVFSAHIDIQIDWDDPEGTYIGRWRHGKGRSVPWNGTVVKSLRV